VRYGIFWPAAFLLGCGSGAKGAANSEAQCDACPGSGGDASPPSDDAGASDAAGAAGDSPGPGDAGGAGDVLASADGAIESGAGDAARPSTMWVMGYYSGWDSSLYPVSAIDWNGLTHLAVAFYLPDTQGNIDETLSHDATTGPALGHSLVTAAHQAGKKIIASLGGSGSQAMWQGSTSAAYRPTFVSNLKKLVASYGFDGLDLDWEPFDAGDHAALQSLVGDLRSAITGILITMPVGCENNNAPDNLSFFGTLAPSVDRLNLMSYGLSGAWQGWKSWHSSPLYWNGDTATPMGIDSSVADYLAAGVPAGKLGVGSGFYGECYTAPVIAPDQALGGSTVAASDGTMSYTNIMASYYSAAAYKWDNGAKVPYLTFASAHGAQSCTYVSYEDEQAIAAKGAFAKSKGLGGVIIWTINEGYVASAPAGKQSPLLEAMRTAFLQ
jgi:chitinase